MNTPASLRSELIAIRSESLIDIVGIAMPVRKQLLLVLLDKETYDYVCTRCGSPLGKKEEPMRPAPLAMPKMRGKRR